MIIIMGVVGAGKSLQGQLFAKETGYKWVSTGELFRAYLPEDHQKDLLTGKLLDDQEVIELVDRALDEVGNSRIVLDGFPRTIVQAQWLLDQINNNRVKMTSVFNLVADREVVTNRLLARGRGDDVDAIIDERFHEYETKTVPLVDFFKKNNIDVVDIDADQTPEKVHEDIMKLVKI